MGRFPVSYGSAEEMVAAIDIAVGEDHQRVAKADQSVEVFTGGVHSQGSSCCRWCAAGPAPCLVWMPASVTVKFDWEERICAPVYRQLPGCPSGSRSAAAISIAQQVGAGGLAVKAAENCCSSAGWSGAVGPPLAGEKVETEGTEVITISA